MLHAVIRSERNAFHFFGSVSGYNVETLRQHVRATARETGRVQVRVEVEPSDHAAFTRYAGRWLKRLSSTGVVVEVVPTAAPPMAARPSHGAGRRPLAVSA